MSKICCVFNYNPLYRFPIYDAMSKVFECDFFFGDSVFAPLKQFEASSLKGFKGYLKAEKKRKGFIWFRGITKTLKYQYDSYILTGDAHLIANWIIVVYAKLFGKKVYCWCHGLKSNKGGSFVRWFAKPFYKSMDGIFLYNNYNKQFMLPLGIKESKLYTIHNSLNTKVQTDLYNCIKPTKIYQEHFGNTDPVVIFIGRIQKRMKVQYLIEAADLLMKKGRKLNIVLVGAYMDGDNIEQLVNEKGMQETVWFYGPSFDETINSELIYNADVCVAPGTIGLTAIHSLSYGTPVITHNNFSDIGPEFEAIIPGKTGDFFVENDIQDLAMHLEKWISLSNCEREEVRIIARETVLNNWSVQSQIELLKQVLL